MVRLLLLLLGSLMTSTTGRRAAAGPGTGGRYGRPDGGRDGRYRPGAVPPAAGRPGEDSTRPLPTWPESWRPPQVTHPPAPPYRSGGPRPRRRRVRRWVAIGSVAAVAALVFRKAIAAAVLTALSAALHLVGISVHLPHIRFAWPWQSVTAGTATTTDLGPWILQKIQGISRPALGEANFSFYFTHKVSKSIGPWPCWYASTFYAVGRASATVNLNPGPAWWRPAAGHYQLQVVSRPWQGRPGRVTVAMVLPRPQLPRSAGDVSINNIPSRPVATQHSWTYPGLGCGLLLRPQFQQSVLYAQAQRIAFYKASHSPQLTGQLVRAAENQAVLTIRDNFIQPTVNAFGYRLDRFTVRWAAGP